MTLWGQLFSNTLHFCMAVSVVNFGELETEVFHISIFLAAFSPYIFCKMLCKTFLWDIAVLYAPLSSPVSVENLASSYYAHGHFPSTESRESKTRTCENVSVIQANLSFPRGKENWTLRVPQLTSLCGYVTSIIGN